MKQEIVTIGSKRVAISFDETIYTNAQDLLNQIQTYKTDRDSRQIEFDGHELDFKNGVINEAQFLFFRTDFQQFQEQNEPRGYEMEYVTNPNISIREIAIMHAQTLRRQI